MVLVISFESIYVSIDVNTNPMCFFRIPLKPQRNRRAAADENGVKIELQNGGDVSLMHSQPVGNEN